MRFELTIPGEAPGSQIHVIEVDAQNWLAALQKGLTGLGDQQLARGKAVCDVRDDGVIVVRDALTGRQFSIRTLPDRKEPAPPVAPPPKEESKPCRTVTYLEEELRELKRSNAALARVLDEQTDRVPPVDVPMVKTSGHPCVVISRKEIQRRLREQQEAAGAKVAPPLEDEDGAHRPVRFIQVVDVEEERRSDTLTSLKVDLQALRAAADQSKMGDPEGNTAPEGFEWIKDPLDSVLSGAREPVAAADRLLRLSLAAVPSRLAVYLSRPAESARLIAIAVVGRKLEGSLLRPIDLSTRPFSLLDQCGGSIALDRRAGEFSTALLVPLLGSAPENALLAAVRSSGSVVGAILLAGSLGFDSYSPTHLAVTNYIAARAGSSRKA